MRWLANGAIVRNVHTSRSDLLEKPMFTPTRSPTSPSLVRRSRRPLGAAALRASLTITAVSALTISALAMPVTASGADPVSRVVLTDPTGDVWAISEGENAKWTSAGDVPTADVTSAIVRHGAHNVVVKMSFADLTREYDAGYWAMIYTPKKFRAALVMAGPGRWKGRRELVDGQFGKVRCQGFTHTIDYATDEVTMRVPRGCLGRPAWVRVSLQNYSFRGDSQETFQEVTDNPHNIGHDSGRTQRLYAAE